MGHPLMRRPSAPIWPRNCRGEATPIIQRSPREGPRSSHPEWTRPVCQDPRDMRRRIAELSAIVAIEDKMDAKGCYQRPTSDYDRKLVGRLTETLARCEAQAVANP